MAGSPTTVKGELTLRGVSRAVALKIDSFKCIPDPPLLKGEVCGADAVGTFNRSDFGANAGLQFAFRQEVLLRIQVEAIKAGLNAVFRDKPPGCAAHARGAVCAGVPRVSVLLRPSHGRGARDRGPGRPFRRGDKDVHAKCS